jgi:C4-dicarboxylate transporter DctQ subunit
MRMSTGLRRIGTWLRRRAENVAAALLGIMFFVFLLQIVFRYLLNLPIGWTNEVSVITWLWLVPFGAAFVIREQEEIRLDLIWSAAPARVRRIMAVVASVALVGLFSLSLPAVIDYVAFMKVEDTAYLKIRLDLLYSIYVIFAVAMIIRYIWLGCQAVWGRAPADYDPTKASSGV